MHIVVSLCSVACQQAGVCLALYPPPVVGGFVMDTTPEILISESLWLACSHSHQGVADSQCSWVEPEPSQNGVALTLQ